MKNKELAKARKLALKAIERELPLEETREALALYNALADEENETHKPYPPDKIEYILI